MNYRNIWNKCIFEKKSHVKILKKLHFIYENIKYDFTIEIGCPLLSPLNSLSPVPDFQMPIHVTVHGYSFSVLGCKEQFGNTIVGVPKFAFVLL